jgi:hypothetical protein
MSSPRPHGPRSVARISSPSLIKLTMAASLALAMGCAANKPASPAPGSSDQKSEAQRSPNSAQPDKTDSSAPHQAPKGQPNSQSKPPEEEKKTTPVAAKRSAPKASTQRSAESVAETRQHKSHETVMAEKQTQITSTAAKAPAETSSASAPDVVDSTESGSATASAAAAEPPVTVEKYTTAAAPPPPAVMAEEHTTAAAPSKYEIVRVFYATDRKPTGRVTAAKFYGGQRCECDEFARGTLDVSIPPDHHVGEIERPFSVWKFEMHEHPEKDVVLLNVKPLAKDE